MKKIDIYKTMVLSDWESAAQVTRYEIYLLEDESDIWHTRFDEELAAQIVVSNLMRKCFTKAEKKRWDDILFQDEEVNAARDKWWKWHKKLEAVKRARKAA
jgi:hypothetical protein